MKITIIILFLSLCFVIPKAQNCDIATLGVTHNAPAGVGGCVGQLYNFKFTIKNLGSACTIPANSVTAIFDFPTLSGGIKPYVYNGPASFISGYFSWTYNNSFQVLIGTNINAIPSNLGDIDILVQVKGNAAGTGSSTLNLTQGGGTSNNTSNDFSNRQLIINAIPVVNCPANSSVCVNSPAFALSGATPAGGTYTGNGVSSGQFNPAVAGPGIHTITYTSVNANNCSNFCNFSITVNALPVVSFTGLAANYCTTNGAVTLTGTPAGGTFSGPGITGNTFNPGTAGAGSHNVVYAYTAANGCSNTASQPVTVTVCPTFSTLNLKLFLEAFYTGSSMRATLFDLGISTDPLETDTIKVNLWSVPSLSNPTPDHSITTILHTNGSATMQFPAAVSGNSFYIAVTHRNAIETWSKNPVAFTSTTDYDFSTGLNKAYDDGQNAPMANIGSGVFAFYNGDVNHDGAIDATDMSEIDNDNSLFAFGYNDSDVNGDGATDASDISILDNNLPLFLYYARPL